MQQPTPAGTPTLNRLSLGDRRREVAIHQSALTISTERQKPNSKNQTVSVPQHGAYRNQLGPYIQNVPALCEFRIVQIWAINYAPPS